MEFKITKAQGEQLLAYLAQRPFIEVHELVKLIQSLPLIQAIENDAKSLETKLENKAEAIVSDFKARLAEKKTDSESKPESTPPSAA